MNEKVCFSCGTKLIAKDDGTGYGGLTYYCPKCKKYIDDGSDITKDNIYRWIEGAFNILIKPHHDELQKEKLASGLTHQRVINIETWIENFAHVNNLEGLAYKSKPHNKVNYSTIGCALSLGANCNTCDLNDKYMILKLLKKRDPFKVSVPKNFWKSILENESILDDKSKPNKDTCKSYDPDNCSVPCSWWKCNMVEIGRKCFLYNLKGENSVPKRETVFVEKPRTDERGKMECSLQNSTPNPIINKLLFGLPIIYKDLKKEPVYLTCPFFNPDYCTPCKSPDNIWDCKIVKIGRRIYLDKFIEQIPDPKEL